MGLPDLFITEATLIVGVLFTMGIGVIAFPQYLRIAKLCFAAAFILFLGIGIMWGTTTGEPMLTRRMVVGVIGALGAIGVTELFRFVKDIESTPVANAPIAQIQNPVSQAQFDEIRKVEQFFGGKDEMGLRELFDLPFILNKNIDVQITRMKYIKSGREKEFFYSNYSDNGKWIMWAKNGKYFVGPNGVNITAGPKDVVHLVTTTKFQHAIDTIVSFTNSALLPDSIKAEISSFNEIINKHPEIMMQVLDERLNESESYFTHNLSNDPRYAGVIATDYARKAIPLKPYADKILTAISKYWKINN
jgi:hypothetical protein